MSKPGNYPTIAEAKQNGFDSLRLLFAVLVILSHSFPLTQGDNAHEPLARVAAPLMVPLDELTLGSLAVWAFFILSGYLITKSWQRSSSSWLYLKKRFLRIYPGFVVAVSLCALLQIVVADPGTPRLPGWWNFLFHTVRLQIFDTPAILHANPAPNVINGSLWSVQYEFWCYIGVLVLGLAGLLKSNRWIAVVFLIAVGAHTWIDYRHWLPGGIFLRNIFGFPLYWTRVLPFFLAGMYFALNEKKVQLRPELAAVSLLCMAVVTPFPYLPFIVYPIFGSYLLLYLAYMPGIVRLNLGRWGDFSYGTYLYAFPVQQLILYLYRDRLSPWVLFLMATPLSVALGAASWYFIERRFLTRGSKKRHEPHVDVRQLGTEPGAETPGLPSGN